MPHIPFSVLSYLFLLIPIFTVMPESFSEHKNETIRHVVCFKFKESAKKTEIERVEKRIFSIKRQNPWYPFSRMGKE